MYRSLIKNGIVTKNQNTVVIDTNELIAKKLEELSAKCVTAYNPEEFSQELEEDLDAERVAALFGEEVPEGEESDGSFSEGISAPVYIPEPKPVGPTPEELLEQAQAEIAAMRQQAEAEIAAMREETFAKAQQEGYDAGYQEGLAKTDLMQQELEERARQLNADYERMVSELEPQFIDTLTGVYEHVLGIGLENDRQLIVSLAANAIRHIDNAREFMIRVSKEDYPIVSMQKKQLLQCVGNAQATLEVIEDVNVVKNGCIIETEGGIYDCGLGTQLEELGRQLRLLSYQGKEHD